MKPLQECTACGFSNPPGAKFCGRCGARLAVTCPQCRFENPSNFKYCGQCGSSLGEAAASSALSGRRESRPSPSSNGEEAERRQLTVLVCDLVGSTAISERLDPEDLRRLVREYQRVCGGVIDRFGGHIAQYLGDGLLVYFGYPHAHEDDSQRAVHTGLGIIEAVLTLGESSRWRDANLRLAVRVGIHTGPVVAGEMGAGGTRERLALGQTPALADRLQHLAEPNTVVLSAATHALVRGFFSCQALGSRSVHGLSHPMEVYRVAGTSGAQSRFEAGLVRGLTPLIDREDEMQALAGAFERARQGNGQVVLLGGESGIGKSRLVHMLQQRLDEPSLLWLRSQCSEFYENTPLHPMIELVQKLLGLKRKDSLSEQLGKLEQALTSYGLSLDENIPLLAHLLALPYEERYPPLNYGAKRQREMVLETLIEIILKITRDRVVGFIMEDLHWVDPSTMELLDKLIARVPTAPLWVLLSFRPVFVPPWPPQPHVVRMNLDPLSKKHTRAMAVQVAGGSNLPREVLNQLVEKTDGVPIFVEELTKTVLEMGLLTRGESGYELAGPLPTVAIPSTLQDSLRARLDRLHVAKEVAQLGAALGRKFGYELMEAVSNLDSDDLRRQLERLVEAQLLFQRGTPPRATYTFNHALIQAAAYDSLLKRTRQQHHRLIAQVLIEKFPDSAANQPELVAHHYTQAGEKEKAVEYWRQAGRMAVGRSANLEAIEHYKRALDLLRALPETAERDAQELVLENALGPALIAAKGYSAPEVQQSFSRARELCEKIGDTPQLWRAFLGLWMFYVVRADYQQALELGQRLEGAADDSEDHALRMNAHYAVGFTRFNLGELTVARQALEQGMAVADSDSEFPYASLIDDTRIHILSFLALSLWQLGYPGQAQRRSQEAIALARDLSNPFGLAWGLNMATLLHQLCGDHREVLKKAQEVVSLSKDKDIPFFLATGSFMIGWALAHPDSSSNGDPPPESRDAGIRHMRESLEAYHAVGARFVQTYFFSLLAATYVQWGQIEEGMAAVDQGLAAVEGTGERCWEAELYRLRGELILGAGAASLDDASVVEAERSFARALKTARRQQARSLELRAAMSQGRLWHKTGREKKARRLLSEAYTPFEDGFSTGDLKAAGRLLRDWSG